MSTRSTVAIQYLDGTIKSHYNHSDGYLSWTGAKLYQYYRDVDKVKKLIDLGSSSLIHKEVEPAAGTIHSFDNKQAGVTVFYGRDRGEEDVDAVSYKSLDEYMESGDFQEYDYLFKEKNQTWYLVNVNTKKLKKLSALLEKDNETSKEVKDMIAYDKKAKEVHKAAEKMDKLLSREDKVNKNRTKA